MAIHSVGPMPFIQSDKSAPCRFLGLPEPARRAAYAAVAWEHARPPPPTIRRRDSSSLLPSTPVFPSSRSYARRIPPTLPSAQRAPLEQTERTHIRTNAHTSSRRAPTRRRARTAPRTTAHDRALREPIVYVNRAGTCANTQRRVFAGLRAHTH